jgi:hypothetical protein
VAKTGARLERWVRASNGNFGDRVYLTVSGQMAIRGRCIWHATKSNRASISALPFGTSIAYGYASQNHLWKRWAMAARLPSLSRLQPTWREHSGSQHVAPPAAESIEVYAWQQHWTDFAR